jgi:holo-[acyl-carrier protein] synthase
MSASDADASGALMPSAAPRHTIGVDSVEIARVRAVLARHGERFLRRIFTDAELRYAASRISALAGRYAAKEATAKALGTGVGPVGWRNIEVLVEPSGKPSLILHGAAARRARALEMTEWHVSITHSRELATAFVIGVRADTCGSAIRGAVNE